MDQEMQQMVAELASYFAGSDERKFVELQEKLSNTDEDTIRVASHVLEITRERELSIKLANIRGLHWRRRASKVIPILDTWKKDYATGKTGVLIPRRDTNGEAEITKFLRKAFAD